MHYDFFIDGRFGHSTDKTYDVFAPADNSVIASVPDADWNDVNNAVSAAKRAFAGEWFHTTGEQRETLLLKLADAVEKRADDIGRVLGQELGQFSGDCIADVKGSAAMLRFYAGMCTKLYGDVLSASAETLNYVVKQPLGVVGCMPPWNAPFTGAIQKIAPALAAGNTVVLKASDEAPLSTLMLGEAVSKAGFSNGVVNIICGLGSTAGAAMTEHPDIRLISFTGSVNVGKLIMTAAAKDMKRVVLELGGKSPFMVFDDADLDKAAMYAADFGFVFQGQLCCAASRVLVHNSVKSAFLEKYIHHIKSFQPGYPEDRTQNPLAKIGPLFNKKQYDRIEQYVASGKQNAILLTGGERIAADKFGKGYYYQPTVFEAEDSNLDICKEEIFGPVVTVIGFDDEEQAISIANSVDFALSASIWTQDIGRIQRVTKSIESGTVWANNYMQFSTSSPWGGFKFSGMGREYGVYAIEPYCDYKNIWINR